MGDELGTAAIDPVPADHAPYVWDNDRGTKGGKIKKEIKNPPVGKLAGV